jgi:predicted RNA polymerase sigma factor
MIDHLRAELARRRRESAIIHHWPNMMALEGPPDEALDRNQDDTLRLLFMCCHPALTRTSAIAITLRAVGGLTTAETARAYLVPETTMARRISRAKQLIRKSGVGFDMPEEDERQERLEAVLHVLYLVFNEGYATSSGRSLHRVDLSHEAIRLTRALHGLVRHHRLAAVRAHLYERAGDRQRAIDHYRTAAGRTSSIPERNYLLMKAAGLSAGE